MSAAEGCSVGERQLSLQKLRQERRSAPPGAGVRFGVIELGVANDGTGLGRLLGLAVALRLLEHILFSVIGTRERLSFAVAVVAAGGGDETFVATAAAVPVFPLVSEALVAAAAVAPHVEDGSRAQIGLESSIHDVRLLRSFHNVCLGLRMRHEKIKSPPPTYVRMKALPPASLLYDNLKPPACFPPRSNKKVVASSLHGRK